MLKVYLDDVREAPRGWTRTYTVAETIKLIADGKVGELSLDHDLGDTDPLHTGYDVLLWIENHMHSIGKTDFIPKVILFHTQNPVGRKRMVAALESILRWVNK